MASKAEILHKISKELIRNFDHLPYDDINDVQKVIRDGFLQRGRQEGESIVLFDKDVKAETDDDALVNYIHQRMSFDVDFGTPYDIPIDNLVFDPDGSVLGNGIPTLLLYDYGYGNVSGGGDLIQIIDIVNEYNNLEGALSVNFQDNLSQYVTFVTGSIPIDPEKAKEVLDTTIYELLPPETNRQDLIDDFFLQWDLLKGDKPPFTADIDFDAIPDTFGSGDNVSYPGNQEEIESGQNTYSENHDIVYRPSDGFITRLDKHASGTVNQNKTMERLYYELGEYLSDVVKETPPVDDDRPEYESKSDGYLKKRNLNQGIIIRKQEGLDVGLERIVNVSENHEYADPDDEWGVSYEQGPSYLVDGFSISMWVRFLDKTNRGTLFNYGNPLRSKDPKGFMLETYVLDRDEEIGATGITWGQHGESLAPSEYFYPRKKAERFVRLVVMDHLHPAGPRLYDSHVGVTNQNRINAVPEFGETGTAIWGKGPEVNLLAHARVPIDFEEWYFIVATYNPFIDEKSHFDGDGNPNLGEFGYCPNDNCYQDGDFWRGHILSSGYVDNSGLGAKCKVEIISKTDLLRARGYKVQ